MNVDEPLEAAVHYYKLPYSGQFTTLIDHFWGQRTKMKDRGAVHLLTGSPIRSFCPCHFRSSSGLCPTRAALLTSPHSSFSLLLPFSPPTASQSCCSLPLFFCSFSFPQPCLSVRKIGEKP